MGDSTAYIDSTCIWCYDTTSIDDGTSIIIIDGTTTDAEYFAIVVSESLINDYSSIMGPIIGKCASLKKGIDRIRDRILGFSYLGSTPPNIFDNAIANALNSAYNSSAWAQSSDALKQTSNILDKCSFFKVMSDVNSKYGISEKFAAGLGIPAREAAEKAIADTLTKFASSTGFWETKVGKLLSDMVSPGSAPYDPIKSSVTDPESAVSDVIEYGKAAVTEVQTALSSVSKELSKVDKLVECLITISGDNNNYLDIINAMNDELNCYYDQLGVFSDPQESGFGEFNVGGFLDDISALDGTGKSNIKKAFNMYTKSKTNAEGSIAKLKDMGLKTSPTVSEKTIAEKMEQIKTTSKTTQTIPGIPGKTEDKVVEVPEPKPLPSILPPDPPPDPPPDRIAFSQWIQESEYKVTDSDMHEVDPNKTKEPEFLTAVYEKINNFSYKEPSNPPDIKMTLNISFLFKQWLSKTTEEGDLVYYLKITVGLGIHFINRTNYKLVMFSERKYGTTKTFPEPTMTPDVYNEYVFKAIRKTIQVTNITETKIGSLLTFF